MREIHRALSRALTFCCGSSSFDIEQFFHRATWELHHTVESDVTAMAFVMKRVDGTYLVGTSREHQALPAETLLGMLVEKRGERLACRVRDHALDTVRFIDRRFRTSVIVGVEVPDGVERKAESALWFGLPGGAHPGFVAAAEVMGREVSEWFSWYGGVLEGTLRSFAERSQQTKRIEAMTSLIHDARAPLGMLKYLAREVEGAGRAEALRHELEYVEKILASGAPHRERSHRSDFCDVGDVLRRVYRRYARDEDNGSLTIEVGYRTLCGRCSSLELERIVTNLVNNARQHAPNAQTHLSMEERDGTIVVHVRDNGPGIPAATLDALQTGCAVPSGVVSGWGVGLQSCVAKAQDIGGEISISSHEGEGTCVSVAIPRGETSTSVQRLQVADSRVSYEGRERSVDVCVVDDDKEHGASLARLLRGFGLRVGLSDSLESFLRDFASSHVLSILCDAHMPDGGAERLLPIIAASDHPPRLAVVSGDSSDEYLYRLAALGAQGFFTKPVEVDEVVAWVRGGHVGTTDDVGGRPALIASQLDTGGPLTPPSTCAYRSASQEGEEDRDGVVCHPASARSVASNVEYPSEGA